MRTILLGLIFCVSGVPALIYQISWQRILSLHSGVGIYSVAMIVAAFMAGLGFGSQLGGVLSARVGRRGALLAFAGLEVGIGLFAAGSCTLYYDLLYTSGVALYSSVWTAAICHFLALLFPTLLMGMSLPFLVRATVEDASMAGRTIGYLYGANVLGAAIGALLAAWVLIPQSGIRGAVWTGALLNVVAAAGAAGIALLFRARTVVEPVVSNTVACPPAAPRASRPFGLWVILYALAGFQGLALEMVWFRICEVATKTAAFTFGTVIGIYLCGLALGSLLGSWLVLRLRRPLRAFLICQTVILLASVLSVCALVRLPPDSPILNVLFDYWGLDQALVPLPQREFNHLFFVLPLGLFLVPTTLMGFSFAILQRAVHDDASTSGRKVGVLQAANIAGSAAGSLIVGLVLLDTIGSAGTLRLFVVGFGLLFLWLCLRYYGTRPVFVALGVALLLVVGVLPGNEELWLRLHGQRARGALVQEDASGVVTLGPVADRWNMRVNGVGHSWLPFGGIHSQLGIVPALVHPDPKDVAIIGLGSGDTAWAAGCRSETRNVTVFELCSPEVRLLERVAETGDYPRLQQFLRDERVRIVIGDGRNALAREDKKYDLIESDALYPMSSHSGNVFSVEFFQLCASRLKPGGIMCAWAPTPRSNASFHRAFAHVLAVGSGFLLGSNDPLQVDVPLFARRLQSVLERSYISEPMAQQTWSTLQTIELAVVAQGAELNHDLFPRDEFGTAAAPIRLVDEKPTFWGDTLEFSIETRGTQKLTLAAGKEHAGRS
ncbi:MAG: fused MFS/spermidine synthase, partial [Planctomycetota bacterium]